MIPLFFNPKEKVYFFQGEETCNSCGNIIDNQIIFDIQWRRKKEPMFNYYCLNCHSKIKDYGGEVKEKFIAVITDEIPENTYPIFIFPPTLVNYKGDSVFDAATSNSEAEIIDHTKLAGRSDPVAALEIQKNKELLEKKDKELSGEVLDIDKSLKMVKDSKPLIEKEERKLLK